MNRLYSLKLLLPHPRSFDDGDSPRGAEHRITTRKRPANALRLCGVSVASNSLQ
jgi:hypothetical protein